jgi:transposase
MARVEVITGPERRRRWSDEQKRAIVAASSTPGGGQQVARRADAGTRQIYRWRKELQAVTDGFAPVLTTSPDMAAAAANNPACNESVIEVDFAGKVRVRIPPSTPADLAAVVVKALSQR